MNHINFVRLLLYCQPNEFPFISVLPKGGINTNVHDGGIYIKSLVPGGAAEQDGRIQIGNLFIWK